MSSQLTLVANAKAAQMWAAERYKHFCVGVGQPPSYCPSLRVATNQAAEDIAAAEAAQKVGRLPPSALLRMRAIPLELEAIR